MPVNESKIVGTAEAANGNEGYKTLLSSNEFQVIADEPLVAGGTNEGPSPVDYLCMSLAACKAITLRMYVQRKQWDAGEINVSVSLLKAGTTEGAPVHTFVCVLSVAGSLTDEQKQRLLQIEKACPISKLLAKNAEIESSIL